MLLRWIPAQVWPAHVLQDQLLVFAEFEQRVLRLALGNLGCPVQHVLHEELAQVLAQWSLGCLRAFDPLLMPFLGFLKERMDGALLVLLEKQDERVCALQQTQAALLSEYQLPKGLEVLHQLLLVAPCWISIAQV